MKITAITRYKHGDLYAALERLDWTQADLARHAGMSQTSIGHIMNLHKRPTAHQANAIQVALGERGIFVDVLSEWPESFSGLPTGFSRVQTEDMETISLESSKEVLMIEAPESEDETGERLEEMLKLVETLPDRERNAITLLMRGGTLEKAGGKTGVSRERIRQLRSKAIMTLRRKMVPSVSEDYQSIARSLQRCPLCSVPMGKVTTREGLCHCECGAIFTP